MARSTCSFVLPLKSSLQDQGGGGGSVTQLQLPVRCIQNCRYMHSLKNPLSKRKTIIQCKFSESKYHSEKLEHVEGSTQRTDIWKQLNALYKFSRPYIVINTALVPSIIMNLYGVGLNQLSDVDIDTVNKPHLAIASGEISTEFAKAITSIYLLMSVTMGIMFQSPPLLFALLVRFLLLTAYSVQVFWLCVSMLLIGYGCAMAIGASSSILTSKFITVLGHCVLASTLWFRARSIDLDDNASISSFYMFIWKLVYAEYLLIPFIR